MDNEVKEFLLTWLINHGRDVVWLKLRDLTVEQWRLLDLCMQYGYIDSLTDPFDRHQNNRLTDEGMEFLNERHK